MSVGKYLQRKVVVHGVGRRGELSPHKSKPSMGGARFGRRWMGSEWRENNPTPNDTRDGMLALLFVGNEEAVAWLDF